MAEAVSFGVKPTLADPRVVLRPFTSADIAAMGPILNDPEVLRLTGSAHTSEAAHAGGTALNDANRRWYETRNEQADRLDLAVVERASDRCVGEVALNDWQPANESCNFRILIGPGGRDRGLGSRATQLILEYAFLKLQLYRVELEVYAFNARAQHVYERAGFTVEGCRRGALLFDGNRIDAVTMAALRPEWLAANNHPGD